MWFISCSMKFLTGKVQPFSLLLCVLFLCHVSIWDCVKLKSYRETRCDWITSGSLPLRQYLNVCVCAQAENRQVQNKFLLWSKAIIAGWNIKCIKMYILIPVTLQVINKTHWFSRTTSCNFFSFQIMVKKKQLPKSCFGLFIGKNVSSRFFLSTQTFIEGRN